MQNDNNVQGKADEPKTAPAPVESQQPAPMPSGEQTTEEIHPPVPEGSEDDLTLPEEASERTKQQFDKLKQKLADKEALLASKSNQSYGESVFDSFHAQPQAVPQATQFEHLNQHQVEQVTQQFVDTEGNVDINALNKALVDANRRAALAEQRSAQQEERLTRFEESQQVREAHQVFPQLDPKSSKFDPKFFELTRDRILRTRYFEGGNVTLLDAANAVSGSYRPQVNEAKVKEEAVAEFQKNQAARNQGPIEQGKGEVRNTVANLDELRERTRRNDPSAVAERLKNLGI